MSTINEGKTENKTSVRKKQAKRRAEIIEAVIPLITGEEFDTISVNDLCRAAGISVGTFYHYFTQKTDMLVGLLWLIDEDLEQNTFPLLNRKDEMENLRILAHGWAKHVEEHGLERSKVIATMNLESEVLVESERSSIQRIHKIFEDAQKKGQISKENSADTLTEYFLLMLRSVSSDWSRRDGKYDIVRKMDELTEFFIRSCRRGNTDS